MLGGVFISYRREDSGGFAGRIYDRLTSRLGRDSVFFDVDNIPPGVDFVEVLSQRVGKCDALIAVIGKAWNPIAEKGKRPRLDDPNDFVRIEIEAALGRGVRVIPVLVDGAEMPRAADLPEGLKKLCRRQGIEISHTRFDSDVERLTRALSQLEGELRQRALSEERERQKIAEAAENAEQARRLEASEPQREEAGRASESAEIERAEGKEREQQEAAEKTKREKPVTEAARQTRRPEDAEAHWPDDQRRDYGAADAERSSPEERQSSEVAVQAERERLLAEAAMTHSANPAGAAAASSVADAAEAFVRPPGDGAPRRALGGAPRGSGRNWPVLAAVASAALAGSALLIAEFGPQHAKAPAANVDTPATRLTKAAAEGAPSKPAVEAEPFAAPAPPSSPTVAAAEVAPPSNPAVEPAPSAAPAPLSSPTVAAAVGAPSKPAVEAEPFAAPAPPSSPTVAGAEVAPPSKPAVEPAPSAAPAPPSSPTVAAAVGAPSKPAVEAEPFATPAPPSSPTVAAAGVAPPSKPAVEAEPSAGPAPPSSPTVAAAGVAPPSKPAVEAEPSAGPAPPSSPTEAAAGVAPPPKPAVEPAPAGAPAPPSSPTVAAAEVAPPSKPAVEPAPAAAPAPPSSPTVTAAAAEVAPPKPTVEPAPTAAPAPSSPTEAAAGVAPPPKPAVEPAPAAAPAPPSSPTVAAAEVAPPPAPAEPGSAGASKPSAEASPLAKPGALESPAAPSMLALAPTLPAPPPVLSNPSLRFETLTPERERELRPKDIFKDCRECPEMVVVPAGAFTMGSSAAEIENGFGAANEGPQHSAVINRRFALARTEVTRDEFEAFVAETQYPVDNRCHTLEDSTPQERTDRSFRKPGFDQTGNHPVVCVNWLDAMAYAEWLSRRTGKTYRLPSEAEYEYAARAGGELRYGSTDDPADLCKFVKGADQSTKGAQVLPADFDYLSCSNGYAHSAPAGSFAANAFGLYDLQGNVWEWTADCYRKDYSAAPADLCVDRTVRGGSWSSAASSLRPSVRAKAMIKDRYDDVGFRVARELES